MSRPAKGPRLVPANLAALQPRPHQQAAIEAALNGFVDHSRGQVIMACGTGKTLVAQRIAESLEATRVLVLVPSLALLAQTARVWAVNARSEYSAVAACSEDVEGFDEDLPSVNLDELTIDATTEPNELLRWTTQADRIVVFGTYQSSPTVAEAHQQGMPAWDLIICDEAHRMAGAADGAFATGLSDQRIPARHRLFLTATPRVHEVDRLGERVQTASMDDPSVFGPVMHTLALSDAIAGGLLSDYRVLAVGVTRRELLGKLMGDQPPSARELREAAVAVAIARTATDYGVRSMLCFHNRVSDSARFATTLPATLSALPPGDRPPGRLSVCHVDGRTPPTVRDEALDTLNHQTKDQLSVVSNVRCLAEGVDIPLIDSILIAQPRTSVIEITQALGRAIRLHPDRPQQPAIVLLPFFIADEENPAAALSGSEFRHVHQTLSALQDQDSRVVATIREMGRPGAHQSSAPLERLVSVITIGDDAEAVSSAIRLRLVSRYIESVDRIYERVRRYAEDVGTAKIPMKELDDDGPLGTAVSRIRERRKRGELTEEWEARFETLPGWTWAARARGERHLESALIRLEAYAKDHGTTDISSEVTDEHGRLGILVITLRQKRKNGRISDEWAAKFEALPGWTWRKYAIGETQLEETIARVRAYVETHGTAAVPTTARDRDGNLGNTVSNLRARHRAGSLSEEWAGRFEALPGWTWRTHTVGEDHLEEVYLKVLKHVETQGTALIRTTDVETGRPAAGIRRRYKRGKLPDEWVAKFEALPGWTWAPGTRPHPTSVEPWLEQVHRASAAYATAHGSARIPTTHPDLGWKVVRVRQRHRKGLLSDEWVAKFEALPGWTWEPKSGTRISRPTSALELIEGDPPVNTQPPPGGPG